MNSRTRNSAAKALPAVGSIRPGNLLVRPGAGSRGLDFFSGIAGGTPNLIEKLDFGG